MTPRPSGPRTNGNEGVLHIPQSSRNEAAPLDGLVSYPGQSLEWGLTSLQRYSQYIPQLQPTGLFNQWVLGKHRIVQMQHPLYSSDPLALSNIFLFSKLKIYLKENIRKL